MLEVGNLAPKCWQYVGILAVTKAAQMSENVDTWPKFSPPACGRLVNKSHTATKGSYLGIDVFLGVCARLRAGSVGYKRRFCGVLWVEEDMLAGRLNIDQHVAAFAA